MTLYDAQGNFIVGPTIPLSTRRRRDIPNEQRMSAPPLRMQAAKDMILMGHPGRNVRSLSSVYNCMGMVFASRRTWVWPKDLQMILEDDDYRPVYDESELVTGDLVVYTDGAGDISHIAVITEVRINLIDARREIFVTSKWGDFYKVFIADRGNGNSMPVVSNRL